MSKIIIEVIISSTNDLSEHNINRCAKNHLLGNYNYNIIGNIKVRNFHNKIGKWNRFGKFIPIKTFNKNRNNVIQACYDEIIEAELNLVKI